MLSLLSLPVPVDDGTTVHLVGMQLPSIRLHSTDGRTIDASQVGSNGLGIIYIYPRTIENGRTPSDEWNLIPGARGCTPEACSFRDHFAELSRLGVADLFGLSTQTTEYQSEFASRTHLPFGLLSDADFVFGEALELPEFSFEGERLWKRLTLVIKSGRITHVFYPICRPDLHSEEVIAWLITQQS